MRERLSHRALLKLFHLVSMYYLHSASRVTYQSLAMPLKGRYKPADRPRNELEGTRGGG